MYIKIRELLITGRLVREADKNKPELEKIK
jgi:hypothetical protein